MHKFIQMLKSQVTCDVHLHTRLALEQLPSGAYTLSLELVPHPDAKSSRQASSSTPTEPKGELLPVKGAREVDTVTFFVRRVGETEDVLNRAPVLVVPAPNVYMPEFRF